VVVSKGKPLDPVCYRTQEQQGGPRPPCCKNPKQTHMSATSINIQPIKSSSEIHNRREKDLSYVRKELSPLNEKYEEDTIYNRLSDIKDRYTKTTRQQMQKKATPIREGVVVIGKDTTMEHLKEFAQKCEQRFGIKAFQIHIHRDEGHMKSQDWKPNLHAHMVFDWTDKGGKSIKLNRQDMSEMQTLLADSLQMDRGVSSDKKHLTALQFKTEKERSELVELNQSLSKTTQILSEKQQKLTELKTEIVLTETKKSAHKAISKASERFSDLLGMTKNDKEKEGLKTALSEAETTIENQARQLRQKDVVIESQTKKLSVLSQASEENKAIKSMLSNDVRAAKELRKELGAMFSHAMNPEQWEAIRQKWPKVHEAARQGVEELKKEQNNSLERKKGFGMGR
jgi:hypothetical protein